MDVVLSPHWYALNVRVNREHSVSLYLKQMGVPDYLPLHKRSRDGKLGQQRPLFPGYLFCYIDLDRAPKLYQIPGYNRILGAGKHPIQIEDSEIELVRSLVDASVRIEPCPHVITGGQITVTAGPFGGARGVVLQARGLRKVIVSLPLLGRSIAVTVPVAWVIPCDAGVYSAGGR
jgi:transcription antitermination factor NusG